MLRAVIDTNVLFEGLSRHGPAGLLVDAWVAQRFIPCVSTALALEYEEVFTDHFSARRWPQILAALQALLHRVEFVPILSRVRPLSPDPDDDFVIECAFNAGAVIVTHNLRDLRIAQEVLNVSVMTAVEFMALLEDWMARLTLRLPDSLHDTLVERARREGVSVNQFLVYALTQVAALDLVTEQRARFEELRSRFPAEEAEQALKELLEAREH